MTIKNSLIESFARTTEKAAIGAYNFIGKNDKISADQAAVDGMRKELNNIEMKGKIVIGEGELDEAPMLYTNELVGSNNGDEFDIAVDPLEGTNFTAKNLPNSLSVLAVSKKGNLLNAPETYMEKIAIGPGLPKNLIDLDYDIEKNIELLANAKNTIPRNLSACILDRPRHKSLINKLESIGMSINLITDGDVYGVLSVGISETKNDIYLGTGGGPEGVLAAAALSCLNCQMQTRLVFQNSEEKNRAKEMGIKDFNKKYYIDDMIKGDVIFCATGITDGNLVNGIKLINGLFYSETLVLHKSSKTSKIIKNKTKK